MSQKRVARGFITQEFIQQQITCLQLAKNSKVYVDKIEGFPSLGQLFASSQPDLIMALGDVYYVFELTVSFETNLNKTNECKTKKYDDLRRDIIDKRMKLELFSIEISSAHFISNNLKSFSNLIKTWGVNVNHLVNQC